ncbi:MAG: hypothetical protein HGA67_00950 [Candidatus Yonathbacteria bacterium]|nr:hypothetical protein [Candidatus Yonathbacteria bacterium]
MNMTKKGSYWTIGLVSLFFFFGFCFGREWNLFPEERWSAHVVPTGEIHQYPESLVHTRKDGRRWIMSENSMQARHTLVFFSHFIERNKRETGGLFAYSVTKPWDYVYEDGGPDKDMVYITVYRAFDPSSDNPTTGEPYITEQQDFLFNLSTGEIRSVSCVYTSPTKCEKRPVTEKSDLLLIPEFQEALPYGPKVLREALKDYRIRQKYVMLEEK